MEWKIVFNFLHPFILKINFNVSSMTMTMCVASFVSLFHCRISTEIEENTHENCLINEVSGKNSLAK